MRDYFQWFDPFAAREGGLRDGREEVLDQIGRECLPEFLKQLDIRARVVADDLARQVLEPKMKERLAGVRHVMVVEDALAKRITLSIGPELHSLLEHAQPRLEILDGPKNGTAVAYLSVDAKIPVSRTEAFPSRDWR